MMIFLLSVYDSMFLSPSSLSLSLSLSPTHTHTHSHIRRSLNRFTDFFRMGTFIDSTYMKL